MSFGPWKRRQLEQYVKLYYPNQIPLKDIFGYDLQKKAAQAMALAVVENAPFFLLLFGIPGTGKTEFVYNLAFDLNKKFKVDFSLMVAKCDELLRQIMGGRATPRDVTQTLENKVNQAWQNKPSIIVFDEIDSLSPPISSSESYISTLTRWIRAYSEEGAERTLTIGTTNWPNVVDFSVMRRVSASIFFDSPSSDVTSQIIGQQLGIRNSEKVSSMVLKDLKSDSFIPLASDIVKGCQRFRKRHPEPHKVPFKEMCEELAALIGGSMENSLEIYYNDYSSLIKKSQKQTEYWARQFDVICKDTERRK